MTQKTKVGLIDDEESVLMLLGGLIAMLPEYEVGFATTDPVQGLEWIRRARAEILITDIIMPELGGLEISKRLLNSRVPVIICSGHPSYAVHGFKVDAVDFLVKPPSPHELSDALGKASKKIDALYWVRQTVDEDFVVIGEKYSHNKYVVKPDDILFMEQREKHSVVKYGENKEFMLFSTFEKSLNKLKSPYMVRIHQSYAVNILKVKSLKKDQCELYSGDLIPISRLYKTEIHELFYNKMIN